MPPPTFDLYTELELEVTASQQEITTSYRRLARLHHPDENPEDLETSTAKFQRLQAAHEILSDETKRRRYDASRNGRAAYYEDDDGWEDDEDEGLRDMTDFIIFNLFMRGGPFGTFGRPPFVRMETPEERAERFQVEAERREKRARVAAEWEAAKQQRQAEATRRQADWEAKRKAEEEAALRRRKDREEAAIRQHKEQEQARQKEEALQEQRWEALGASTKAERKGTCLHSAQCIKQERQVTQSKCEVCRMKHGVVTFKCPHCNAFLCQRCASEYPKRVRRATRAEAASTNVATNGPDHASDKVTPKPSAPYQHKKQKRNKGAFQAFVAREKDESSIPTPELGPSQASEPQIPAPKDPASVAESSSVQVNQQSAQEQETVKEEVNSSSTKKTKPVREFQKPVKNPSTTGPDPGYEGSRHIRCGFLHKGGDASCYIMNPDLRRPSRKVAGAGKRLTSNGKTPAATEQF
jgi:curved DNA-binding protein CbpA